ncbi:MAG: putative toxin-antitoxin system toxin component, PIN family [Bacteroidetes bacterium]|nr:putative toxin-antitoxin system toxin component, PIN family [Bacteroidota bacterium]
MNEKLKVIIDTNLWLNFLITSRLVDLDPFFKDERILLVFSQELLEEFDEVARRPKFRRYFSEAQIDALLTQFEVYGTLILVASEVQVCRDPKDNFLLALAQDCQANFLVTKDDDLLILGSFGKTQIVDYFGLIRALEGTA